MIVRESATRMSTSSQREDHSAIVRFERLLRFHELCADHLPAHRVEIEEILRLWDERLWGDHSTPVPGRSPPLPSFSKQCSSARDCLRERRSEFAALKTRTDADPQSIYSKTLEDREASAREKFQVFSDPIQSEINWLTAEAKSIRRPDEHEPPSDSDDTPSKVKPRVYPGTQTAPVSERSKVRDSILAEYHDVCAREKQILADEEERLKTQLEELGVSPDSYSAPFDDRSQETVQTAAQSKRKCEDLEAEAQELRRQLTELEDRVFPQVRVLTCRVRQRLADLAGVELTDGDVWAEMNANFAAIQAKIPP
jgi:hypothetical protein